VQICALTDLYSYTHRIIFQNVSVEILSEAVMYIYCIYLTLAYSFMLSR